MRNILGLGDGGGVDYLRVCCCFLGGGGDGELNVKKNMMRIWVLLCSDKMRSALI